MLFLPVLLITGLIITGCNNGAPQRHEVVNDWLYLDYQATGEAGRDEIIVRVQFRLAGPEGQALLLDTPAAVLFDGQPMQEGETRMNGGYYEAAFLLSDDNHHVITYKDPNGHIYNDTFEFPAFAVREELPEIVERAKGLHIHFTGLDSFAVLHSMLTDTSFYGRGIDRMDTVRNNQLYLSEIQLHALRDGPIHLEFYREEEHYLQRNGRLHGRMYLSYNISKEFILK